MTEEQGLVNVGNYRLAYTCLGTGSPVVVLEAGGGISRGTWNKIMPAVADFTQVVSYDRASLGDSDPGPRGRTCHDLANDLAQILQNLGITGPYILVGNSLGGHIIRYFAYQHPGEVVGMVLLDSMHPDQNRRAFSLLPSPSSDDSPDLITLRRNLTNLMKGIINEPDQDPEGLDYYAMDEQVRRTGSLGDMPLVVITAGNQAKPDLPLEYLQAYHDMFRELQIELTRLSTRGRQVIVEQSGYFIQEDEPELVIGTIRQMVDDTRRRTIMNMKEHILAALREQLGRWEALLATLSADQITAPHFDYSWSIKDVIAHLWAWQQISIARVEAAGLNQEPEFPEWVVRLPGGWEENANGTNARIYEICHAKPWSEVYQNWRDGFRRLLASGEPVSEKDLLDGDRYPWLNGYSLAFIFIASYDHHQEHLEKLLVWLQESGNN